MGLRGVRTGQDRSDHDHGASDQGRRQQVRHVGSQLHGPRRQAGSHPAGGPEGLRHQTQTYVKVHQDQELWRQRVRPLVRSLPGVQVP